MTTKLINQPVAASTVPTANWLLTEEDRLVDFATGSRWPDGGFGWLDDAGAIDPSHPVQTWITARMTYIFALAHLHGRPGAAELVDHGLSALTELMADRVRRLVPSGPGAGAAPGQARLRNRLCPARRGNRNGRRPSRRSRTPG